MEQKVRPGGRDRLPIQPRKRSLRDFFLPLQYDLTRDAAEGVQSMNDVGKNIRRYREEKKLTQDALAEKLHVTRQAGSNWETGKNQPDLDMLEALAGALDL